MATKQNTSDGVDQIAMAGAPMFPSNQVMISGNNRYIPATAFAKNPNPDLPGTNVSPSTCPNPTYRIDKIWELSGGTPTPGHPNPHFAQFTGTECILIASLKKCCNGVEQDIGWFEIARTNKYSYSYELCPDGKTLKASVKSYYSISDFYLGYRVVNYTDNFGNLQTLPTNFSELSTAIFSDTCSASTSVSGFDFTQYIQDKIYNGIQIDNKGEFRGVKQSVIIYDAVDQLNYTNIVSDNAYNVIESGCGKESECIYNKPEKPKKPDERVCVTITTPSEYFRYLYTPGNGNLRDTRTVINGVSVDDYLLQYGTSTELSNETDSGQVLNDGKKVNLTAYGFPCERGVISRYQKISYKTYLQYEYCIYPDGSVTRTLTGNKIYDFNDKVFSGGPVDKVVDGTREFDPSCCERVKNAFITNNQSELSKLASIGVTVGFINSTKRSELFESCGCEEIEIADLGCFYNKLGRFLPYSTVLSGNIKDRRTYTGVSIPVVDERCQSDGPKVYHPFDKRKDIITNRVKSTTKGLFDNNQYMECFFTSSTKPTASNAYYYEVTDCETCGKIPYFAVAYGHIYGSGSLYVSNEDSNKTPSDSIYSQYQLICLESNRTDAIGTSLSKFSFISASTSVESDDIYVINFNRNGIKDKLDPGNFQINLASLSGSFFANNVHTGSNVKVGSETILQLIDDSDDFEQFETCDGDPLTSYNIVSGSLINGKYESASVNTYGKVYPNLGIVILHPKRLNELANFNTVTGSNINGDNSYKLFTSISGAAAPFGSRTESKYLTARNIKYKTTSHYFVRAYSPYFNYSNNPTFVSGSSNQIFDKCFIKEPQTYISSVGLYNSKNELLAIAKLSKPIKKSFDTDLLIKIRLNW